MNGKPPSYTMDRPRLITGLGSLWPVIQHHGDTRAQRTVGYFCSQADAEAYVGMATYMEKMAADKEGNRTA